MKYLRYLLFLIITLLLNEQTHAQYAINDHWYDNPLGFEPLKLHTSMGFLVPAAAVGVCLLLTKKDPELAQKLSVYNESGFTWGYKYPYTFMAQNNTGLNYQLRKFMSVGAEFSMSFPRDRFNSTNGLSGRLFARFYPVNNAKWKLYFESGAGLIYLFNEFPQPTDQDNRPGTHLNGMTKYGLGTEIRLTGSTYFVAGARHLHISNGNTRGVQRNPSHDSNGFFAGFSIRL